MTLILKLLRPIIGKNLPSLARSLATLAGSGLVSIGALTAAQTADGVQIAELFQILGGVGLVFVGRVSNWLRAKDGISSSIVSPLIESVGPFIGRSLQSGIRTAMTAVAGWLGSRGLIEDGTSVVDFGNIDLQQVFAAALLFVVARGYSFLQDKGK